LGTLLLHRLLGLGPPVLDLARLYRTAALDALLADSLLPRKADRDQREHDRDDEQLQPIPDGLTA
jgi:hypothetical protein